MKTDEKIDEIINQLSLKIHEKEDFGTDDFDSLLNLKIAMEETLANSSDADAEKMLDNMKQALKGDDKKLEAVEKAITDKFNELQEEDKADNMDIDW